MTTPQLPGAVGPYGPNPAENRGGKGLVAAALAAGLVAIAFMVGTVVVLAGSHDKTPTAASAITPAPSGLSDAGGSSDAVLAPLPGFTYKDAPASAISELKQSFEEGFRSNLKAGVTVTPDDVLASISGRVVSRDGKEVALAVTMKFDDQWIAQLGASDLLARAADHIGAAEHVTVSGNDAVYATSDGTGALLVYKDATFLIAFADAGDRATLDQVMTALIANMS